MLINVDQLWKPASNPPEYSSQFYCRVRHLGYNNDTKASIVHYHYRGKTEEWWWETKHGWAVEYWMENLPAPGVGNLMEIPSEATLQLYRDDSELACIKVELREGQSGAAIGVLIRTTFSDNAKEEAKDNIDEVYDDDEVTVTIQPYESESDKHWKTNSMTFTQAEYYLSQEPKE